MNPRIKKYIFVFFLVAFMGLFLFFLYSTSSHYIKAGEQLELSNVVASYNVTEAQRIKFYSDQHYFLGTLSLIGSILCGALAVDCAHVLETKYTKHKDGDLKQC